MHESNVTISLEFDTNAIFTKNDIATPVEWNGILINIQKNIGIQSYTECGAGMELIRNIYFYHIDGLQYLFIHSCSIQ